MNHQLHYIYDPLCGWCYAAAPLMAAAAQIQNLTINLHAGGLWINENRKALGPALRNYVKPLDERINALTGQPFGDRYFNELLLNTNYVLDSEPLIQAIITVEKAGGNPLQMLHRIQQMHYRDGYWTGDESTLIHLAQEQNISAEQFITAKATVDVVAHMKATHQLATRLQTTGYPSLALQQGEHWQLIPLNRYLGKPELFKQHLEQLIAG